MRKIIYVMMMLALFMAVPMTSSAFTIPPLTLCEGMGPFDSIDDHNDVAILMAFASADDVTPTHLKLETSNQDPLLAGEQINPIVPACMVDNVIYALTAKSVMSGNAKIKVRVGVYGNMRVLLKIVTYKGDEPSLGG